MLMTARAANALSAVRGPFEGTYAYTRKVRRVIIRDPDRVRTVLPGLMRCVRVCVCVCGEEEKEEGRMG
jgi:hypothetical protein